MNVNVRLCFELPFMTEALQREWMRCKDKAERQRNIDKRIDLLATLLALYPDTDTEALAKQLGMTKKTVVFYARMFCVRKSKEYRSEINRKNGYHPNKTNPNARQVEKVASNGCVVATYRSVTDAAMANNIHRKTMCTYCLRGMQHYKDGYKYRYKKQ